MGSARTRALIAGRGVVVDVPTETFPGAGAIHPIQRGTIIDTPGRARMRRLLADRLPPGVRPVVIVTAPVLDGSAYRTQARTAVDVLRPRAVLTVPSARGIALASGTDLTRPLLVVDVGAHLTEVVLLSDGAVTDARRTALGTSDLDDTTTPGHIAEAVARMLTAMLHQDHTILTADALRRDVLLAGGGALRPDIRHRLGARLPARLHTVPAPHTAAVRGAGTLLQAAHVHPSASGDAQHPDTQDA
jgi:rod shape-determining protein MreB